MDEQARDADNPVMETPERDGHHPDPDGHARSAAALPAATPPGRPGRRALLGWIVAAVGWAALVALAAYAAINGRLTPAAVATIGGTMIGGGVVLAIVAYLRDRGGRPLAPHVVALGLAAAGTFGLAAGVGSSAQRPDTSVDLAPLAVVAAPYEIGAAPPELESQYRASLPDGATMQVRQVTGPDGSVSILLLIGVASMDWPAFDAGVKGSGGTSVPARIGTHDGRLVQSSANATVLAWATPGVSSQVIAADEPTARGVAEAVLLARGERP